MPELPEVETVRQGLRKLVLNKKIEKIVLLYPKIVIGDSSLFKNTLEGLTIKEIGRRGKYLLLILLKGLQWFRICEWKVSTL